MKLDSFQVKRNPSSCGDLPKGDSFIVGSEEGFIEWIVNVCYDTASGLFWY